MGQFIYSVLDTAISLFSLALLVYVVLSWLRIGRNRWTELLNTIVEIVLNPVRTVLRSRLPARWQILDWSPLVTLILIGLVRSLLKWVLV